MFFQRPKPGFWDFDSSQDRLALSLGQSFPRCTKLGLPDLVSLGLNLVVELAVVRLARSQQI